MTRVKVTFKSPDAVDYAIKGAVESAVQASQDLDRDELEDLRDAVKDDLWDTISRWVRGGEYVTIEFDIRGEE